jgi:hypothetical protein
LDLNGAFCGWKLWGSLLFSEKFWSHPPGSNRRPADYESSGAGLLGAYSDVTH